MKKQAGLILGLVFSLVLALVSGGCEEPWPPVEVFVSGYTDGQVSGFAITVRNVGFTRLLNIDVRASLHGNRLLGSATNGIPDANSQQPAKNYGDYIGWVNLEPIEPGADQGPFVFKVDNTGEGPVTHVWVKFKTETTEGEVSTPIERAKLVKADPVERAFIEQTRRFLPWPPVEVSVSGYTDGQVSVFAIIVRNGSTRLLNIDVRAGLHGNRLLGSATNGIPDANSQHPAKNYGDYIGWVNLEPIGPRADQGPFVFVVENTGEGPVTHVWVKFKTETTEGEVSTPIKRARLVDEADPVERAFIDRVRSLLLGN